MIASTVFFTGLDQVILPATAPRGERFAELYYLTTDRRRIAEIVQPFASMLGTVEASYLLERSKGLVYRVSHAEINVASIGDYLAELLIEDMLIMKDLQFQLWVHKDNAVYFDRSWIAATTPQGTVVNNNTWESRNSCADGLSEAVCFDAEELRLCRRNVQAGGAHIQASSSPTMLTSASLRFQRFQYFVAGARASMDVAIKIAQYCSGLEALVSTAQAELSHQVSERVAAALAPPGQGRVDIFKQVKEAYGYRSKTVHGAAFKQRDFDRLRECAIRTDNICRSLVASYLEDKNGLRSAIESSDEAMTEFFIRRTLGGE